MSLDKLPSKPNIVLIVTDQEREVMHWPEGWADENLLARKRLMANGLTFQNAHCATAACSPSRASLFTGVYPAQHGVKNLIFCDNPKDKAQRRAPQLPTSLPNMATVLAEAGYYVVLKGKFHLSRPVNYNPEMKRHYWSDDDIKFMEERYGFHEWNPPDMADPTGLGDYGGGSINNDGRYVDGSGTAAGHEMPTDEQIRQSAVHFIDTYNRDEPFCLIVSLVNPHDVQGYPGGGVSGLRTFSRQPVYEQGGYQLKAFQDLPIDPPPTANEDLSSKPTVHSSMTRFISIATGNVSNETRQKNYARFYAYLCREVDRQVTKVLDALDRKGLTEDTLIIRTSDHGELGLAHGMREKFYNAYRESLSVPLIFSNPKLFPEPQTTDAFASLVDLLPTLAALTDVPNREQYQFRGKDLTPILKDSNASVQEYLHFTYEDDVFPLKGANCIRALIEKDWKYAVYYDPFKGEPTEYEMYDLKSDPLETTNLAHPTHFKPEYAEERTRLHNRLIEVMQEQGTLPDEVKWPTADEYQPVRLVGAATSNASSSSDLIDRSIKVRRWVFFIIMLLTGYGAFSSIVFEGGGLISPLIGLIMGILFGIFIFSRISTISWDEDEGKVVSSMDLTGQIILVGYILFILVRTLPERPLDGPTLDATVSSVTAGIMVGQLYFIRDSIHRILGNDREERRFRRYEAQIDINAPVEDVWQVFTDFESFGSWNPLLTSVELENGDELAENANLRLRVAGIPGKLKATVLEHNPPYSLRWLDHVPLNLMTPRFSVVMEPLDEERTRFTVIETFEGPLVSLLGGRLDRQMPPLYVAMGSALAHEVKQRIATTSE